MFFLILAWFFSITLILVLIRNKSNLLYTAGLVIKLFEFVIYTLLLMWSIVFYGAEFFPLSFSMILNCLLILIWLKIYKNIGIIVLVIIFIFILLSVVGAFGFSDNWWEPSIMMIILVY